MEILGNENLWLYLPLIIWIGGIFYLASGRGSIARTAPFLIPVIEFLLPHGNATRLQNYHVVIRKLVHLAGYAILALLASIVFYNSSNIFAAKFWYLCSFAIVFVVASTDEILQSFSNERVGSLADVALDCIGGLVMISLFWILAPNLFSK